MKRCHREEFRSRELLTIESKPISVSTLGISTFSLTSSGSVMKYGDFIQIPTLFTEKKFVSVSNGFDHTLFLDKNGTVYSVGENGYGQLGTNNQNPYTEPVEIYRSGGYDGKNCVSICASNYFSLILLNNGKVLSFGSNNNGQLGLGIEDTSSFVIKPTKVDSKKAIFIETGNDFAFLITREQEIYCFGSNAYYQLGVEETNSYFISPIKLNLKNIVHISCGSDFTLFLNRNNEIYSCGNGEYGQLGLYSETSSQYPQKIDFNEKVIFTSSGSITSIVITANGDCYGFGYNGNGELGLGNYDYSLNYPEKINVSRIVYSDIGNSTSVLIDQDGNIYVSGENWYSNSISDNHYSLGLNSTSQSINVFQKNPYLENMKISNINKIKFSGSPKLIKTIEDPFNFESRVFGKKYFYSFPMQNCFLKIIEKNG